MERPEEESGAGGSGSESGSGSASANANANPNPAVIPIASGSSNVSGGSAGSDAPAVPAVPAAPTSPASATTVTAPSSSPEIQNGDGETACEEQAATVDDANADADGEGRETGGGGAGAGAGSVAGSVAIAREREGEGEDADGAVPMELEEPLNSTRSIDDPSYIGDNCISTPANTETNSPQMDTEPDSEGMRDGEEGDNAETSERAPEITEAEESPDQSVSSAGASGTTVPLSREADEERVTGESDIPLTADVASSDDVAPADVSSGSADTLQTGISSSTADIADNSLHSAENSAISSSEIENSDLLPSTSSNLMECANSNHGLALVSSLAADALNDLALPNVPESNEDGDLPLENMDGHPDTSAPPLEESTNSQILTTLAQQLQFSRPIATNSMGSHTVVSSSNSAVGVVHHHVSSTSAELLGADESAVSSSMNSNGSTPVNAGTHDAADALATLASAALNRQQSTKEVKIDQEEPWFTVGIVKGTSFTVQNYIADPNIDLSKLSLDNLPDLSGYPCIPLDPGTGYKFRVAAINSCGRGEFGEESAFKTCVPGYPGAPSAIKITKSSEGAHLSWEPPQVSAEGIFEYSVYLAVKPSLNTALKDPAPTKSQLTFVRVYCGKTNTCIVSQITLGNAHVDNSTKPAIIFRIAARNDKGYGPATQVRWLQENKSSGVKRILADSRPPGTPPSKQQKLNMIL